MERQSTALDEMTDIELVEKVKTEACSDSFNNLMNRHAALCTRMSHKYLPLLNERGVSNQDLAEDKHYMFYKAVTSFDTNRKTKFSTWLAICVRYHCLGMINDNEPILVPTEEKDLILKVDSNTGQEEFGDFDFLMSVLDKMHDKRIKKIFISRFLSGPKKKSWKQVAKDVGLSNQQCINLFIRAKRFLRAKLDNPDLIEQL